MFGLTLCCGACSSNTGENVRLSTHQADKTAKTGVPAHPDRLMNRRLKITTEKGVVHARLNDNATVRDFIAMLPRRLTLQDYNQTEKIAPLPERLSTAGTPEGYSPHKGDLAFYAPWGNLCIFYRDFRYSPGLVALGKIDGDDISKLEKAKTVTISIDARQ